MVDILVKIVPQNAQYFFSTKKGTKLLITQIKKGTYGTLLGAILFYNKLTKFLVDILGFKMNPHNECTFNEIIDAH